MTFDHPFIDDDMMYSDADDTYRPVRDVCVELSALFNDDRSRIIAAMIDIASGTMIHDDERLIAYHDQLRAMHGDRAFDLIADLLQLNVGDYNIGDIVVPTIDVYDAALDMTS